MPRRAAPAAPSMPKSPTRIHVKGVQQHAAAASKRKAPMLVAAGAVLCLILGMTLLLWPAAVPDRHLSPSRHPFDQQSAARPLSHDVQGLLERAHKYLSLVDDWTYQPLGDAAQTRKYLTGHPRMSKHVSAFVQVRRRTGGGSARFQVLTCAVHLRRLHSRRCLCRSRSSGTAIWCVLRGARWRLTSLRAM